MIRIILKGGLGNQMFQYAFGKSIALAKKENLVLDTSFLDCRLPVKGFTVRDYELDLFGISEKPQKPLLPSILNRYLSYPLNKVASKVSLGYLIEGANIYAYEPDLVNKALALKSNITLEGYWNNYIYFNNFEKEIKQIYDTDKLYDEKYKSLEEEITNTNSISINIRRGDYLNTKHKDIFVYLDKGYYSKAIAIIRSRIQKPKFFVFSYDDPDWVKNELEFNNDELFIVGKEFAGDRFKTYLRLISLCKHNIISNSTFAFWGSYLNNNVSKITIGPAYWSHKKYFEYPIKWMII